MKQVTNWKLGSMRKEVDWVVYPKTHNDPKSSDESGDPTLFVQSDKRAVSINLRTKMGWLSDGKSHPDFMSTASFFGAKEIDIPQAFIDQCLDAQPKSGDDIGAGGICFVA